MVVIGYLLGTMPTAQVVGRRVGRDPLREGSGNPGASNVYRTAGARAGAMVFAGDLVKGMAATGIGLAAGDRVLGLACGAAAVLGHVAPAWRRFRGGKGVATASGTIVVLFPLVAAVAALAWMVVAKVTGKASLGSLAVAVLIPMAVIATGRPAAEVIGVVAVSALVVVRHAGNIARLARGDERSLHA
ncbi:MAG: acyl phosphate:glycerol-3-phosphate acyltransferase [Actinomycetota bacterium]|nr:acyl phosphate:glycerol-3-phosphate acyltransferase [Actinomycetota bacterium]